MRGRRSGEAAKGTHKRSLWAVPLDGMVRPVFDLGHDPKHSTYRTTRKKANQLHSTAHATLLLVKDSGTAAVIEHTRPKDPERNDDGDKHDELNLCSLFIAHPLSRCESDR